MKLWHDDIRKPPDPSWVWSRTNDIAKTILIAANGSQDPINVCSLDHDMGLHMYDPDDHSLYGVYASVTDEPDGYQLVLWMIENDLVPENITIHSWNPDGAKRMALALNKAGYDVMIAPYKDGYL